MVQKFIIEKDKVTRLMQRLGVQVDEYLNPNANARHETGVDVVAVVEKERVGVQVTDVDTGDVPGEARKAEKRQAQEARKGGRASYAGWAQNIPEKLVAAINRSISRKARATSDSYNERWLLLCAGTPDDAVVSTFVLTQWLSPEDLEKATSETLAKSTYDRVFVLPIVNMEQALYVWEKGRKWVKLVVPEPPECQGPSIWDVMADPEWMKDPESKALREAEKCIEEFRKKRENS